MLCVIPTMLDSDHSQRELQGTGKDMDLKLCVDNGDKYKTTKAWIRAFYISFSDPVVKSA